MRSPVANTHAYGNLNTHSQAYTYTQTAPNSASSADAVEG
jgi:hypothetical protein